MENLITRLKSSVSGRPASRAELIAIDYGLSVQIIQEIKDQFDTSQFQTEVLKKYLSALFPIYSQLLSKVSPQFSSTTVEYKLRNLILEHIQRLPFNDALRPFSVALLQLIMNVLKTDNEENGAICLRIIIELHKTFRDQPGMEDHVQPFFDFFKLLLTRLPLNVAEYLDGDKHDADLFGRSDSSGISGNNNTDLFAEFLKDSPLDLGNNEDLPAATGKNAETNKAMILKSENSFKIMSECPIILVLLFQIYKRFVGPNIPEMIPLIVQVISTRCKAQQEYIKMPTQGNLSNTGPNPTLISQGKKNVYFEYICAEIKIFSFLAYIIKGFAQHLSAYQNEVADAIIMLLCDCPHEAVAMRKELLVAARHILTTDIRSAFVKHIDLLFHEEFLIGKSVTARETLRPLALSMLADLSHHVRSELSQEQITKHISMYIVYLHDVSLMPGIQTMCAKLLLNLIETLVNNPNKEDMKLLLLRILNAFATKLGHLKIIIEKLKIRSEMYPNGIGDETFVTDLDPKMILDIEHLSVIKTSASTWEHYQPEVLRDYKFLFKTLILGLKSIVFGLKTILVSINNQNQVQQNVAIVGVKLSQEETELFTALFEDGLSCFKIFSLDSNNSTKANGDSRPAQNHSVTKEEKEILEHFITVFTLVDQAVFIEVFTKKIPFFLKRIIEDNAMLAIPQYLLASETVSRIFSSILLQALVDRLEEYGQFALNSNEAGIILRLYKLAFMSVTLYPDANESVLQPHIHGIITSCFRYAALAKEPTNYFLLLRALFRNIGGGRFELLYKEVLPLLPYILKTLNQLIQIHPSPLRETFVELCLTVPVRLSVLLPYLSYLTKPLVLSLSGTPELVGQGLRTLELCIDNLTADFLDPILAPVIDDLMTALWKHLKPAPYNQAHSHSTLRILGKLGGRNRKILRDCSPLKLSDKKETLIVSVPFESSRKPILVPLDHAVNTACKCLLTFRSGKEDTNSKAHEYHAQSLQFLKGCLALLIDLDNYNGEELSLNSEAVEPSTSKKRKGLRSNVQTHTAPAELKNALDSVSKSSKEQLLETILETLFISQRIASPVGQESKILVADLLTCFATLMRVEYHAYVKSDNVLGQQCFVSSFVFLKALVLFVGEEEKETEQLSSSMLKDLFKCCSDDKELSRFIFDRLILDFCSLCYHTEYTRKMGGAFGLSIVCQFEIEFEWIISHEVEIFRALLFSLKDIDYRIAGTQAEKVKETLKLMLKLFYSQKKSHSPNLASLMSLIITELSSPNDVVREAIKEMISIVAEFESVTPTELLAPYTERLLNPIFLKPLRALKFTRQIGNIDAVTYCLSLQPPLIDFTSSSTQLTRIIHETYALADAEDQALASRTSQMKNQNAINNLRISCVKLLSVVVGLTGANTEMNNLESFMQLKFRIVQLFFKCLYSKSEGIVEAAKRGLKFCTSVPNRLPREILQPGLKPFLQNLNDHRGLTVESLQGLGRLLEIMVSYFKVEIGQKLLDHLDNWATPQILQESSGKPVQESKEVAIICEILNVIRKLPPSANMFMKQMISKTIMLDQGTKRSLTSPFREPLFKYLCNFPLESVDFFLEHINNPDYGRLFADLLTFKLSKSVKVKPDGSALLAEEEDHEEGILTENPLRTTLSRNIAKLYQSAFSNNSANGPSIPKLFAILWTYRIAEYESGCYELIESTVTHPLVEEWNKKYIVSSSESMELLFLHHRLMLAKIIVFLYKNTEQGAAIGLNLFLSLLFCCSEKSFEYIYVKDFLLETIPIFSREMIEKLLEIVQKQRLPLLSKIKTLRLVLIPALSLSKNLAEDESLLNTLKIVIDGLSSISTGDAQAINMLHIELVQLMSLLVIKTEEKLTLDIKKSMFKFFWSLIKHEDVTIRHSAFAAISLYVSKYEAPEKVIYQVLGQLLKSYHSESRHLARQASDWLLPYLPKRLKSESNEEVPAWVKLFRRILIQEGHLIPQIVHVWGIIIRNYVLFLPYKDSFSHIIMASLQRLGLMPSATAETRYLTLELVGLLLKWEEKNLELANEMISDTVNEHGRRGLAPEYLNSTIRDTVVSYLLRYLLNNYDSRSGSQVGSSSKKSTDKILKMLAIIFKPGMWNDCNVRLSFMEKTFQNLDVNTLSSGGAAEIVSHFTNVVTGLALFVKDKKIPWILDNLSYLQVIIEKSSSLVSGAEEMLPVKLTEIVEVVFKEAHGPSPFKSEHVEQKPDYLEEVSGISSFLVNHVSECLQQGKNVLYAVSIVDILKRYVPHAVDPTLPFLLKQFQRLIKEGPAALSNSASYNQVLIQTFDILNSKIATLGEGRKSYFNCIAAWIEKSTDLSVYKAIYTSFINFVFNPSSSPLNLKEKSLLLLKFGSVENRIFQLINSSANKGIDVALGDTKYTIWEDFLLSILKIYRTDSLNKTELAVRLEPLFLMGLRSDNQEIRTEFAALFEKNLPKQLFVRVAYAIGVQNWESMISTFWLRNVLDLVFDAAKSKIEVKSFKPQDSVGTLNLAQYSDNSGNSKKLGAMIPQNILQTFQSIKLADIINPLKIFYFSDTLLCYNLWVEMFPRIWLSFNAKERHDMNKYFVCLLSKEYQLKQSEYRPNIVMCLLDGAAKLLSMNIPGGLSFTNELILSPYLLKYLAKTFGCWHGCAEILQNQLVNTDYNIQFLSLMTIPNNSVIASNNHSLLNATKFKDAVLDALSEIYWSLNDFDMFYGLWKRRAMYPETNAALTYEQMGLWKEAQEMYEKAQIRARNGLLPFSESEYCLWEDRWVDCTEKLQQWDLCNDLAKHENNIELQLECSWRVTDWNSERESLESSVLMYENNIVSPTNGNSIRLKSFQAFLTLSQLQESADKMPDLQKIIDEGIQACLVKWHSLPRIVGKSHVNVLHSFQQFVELQEASHIYLGVNTNTNNPNSRVQVMQELKGTLGTWRERLPNLWDDINLWSELVAWRQHVFSVINRSYQPLTEQQQPNQPGNNTLMSMAYRGYHEIAWIINRFAHVARKHHLEEVCVNALAKIYTLPNIEIQDAFLKLREQAKCYISDYHFDGGNPHTTGLEVINNTNLHFFQQPQKAEFFALKGVFLGKLGMIEEANQAFSSSLQIDVNLGKAWSSWGRFNDERYESGLKTADFNSSSDNADYHQCAADVVRSYLQAASLNKSQKSRKYIARILNLVGTYGLQVASDSQPLTSNKHAEKVLNTFVQYKGEMHVWYWIPFIPQLLGIIKCQNGEKISFTDNLVTMAKVILLRIAKLYPQSLYFALRRAREEALALNSSQNMEIEENQGSQKKSSDSLDGIVAGGFNGGGNDEELDFTASTTNNQKKDDAMDVDQNILGGNADDAMSTSFSTAANQSPVQHLDNVIGVIKTGFPLLALTLEHLIDQMVNRLLIPFECQLSEVVDAAILELESTGKDFLSEEIISALQKLNTDKKTPAYNEIIESVGILADGNVDQVLESLKAHRKKLLAKIDEISTKQNLNRVSSYLVDFEYQRFDDNLEVPGQYLKHFNKDSNSDFVRIERIKPEYSIIRKYSEKEKRHVFCFKLTFIASDASTHDFIIDNGSPNQTEFSVFASLLNIRLEKQVNSRRRNAVLHTENAVQVGLGKCLSEYDPSIKLLQDLYIEKFEEEDQMWRTEIDSLRFNTALTSQQRADKAIKVIEKAINRCQFYLSEYLLGTCSTLSDFYVFRQRFATSLAGSNFMSFILQLGDRACFKFGFTNAGNVVMRDIDPEYSAEKKDYVYSDALEGKDFAVPFRLSASMQTFLNAFSIEGTYSGNIVAISSSLLENKVPLNYFVSLFVFYDLIGKYHTSGSEHSYDDFVKTFYNIRDSLIGRVEHLSCRKNKVQNEDNVSPIDQPIMDLIKEATNPNNYAAMLLADRSNAKAGRVSVGYDYIPWF